MISAGAGVMGSDNSNGSAHKHLAQFTLSNAPHGPTLSSCLSVCMLTQPTGTLQVLKYISSPLSEYLRKSLFCSFLFLNPYTDNKTVHKALIFFLLFFII